MADLNDTPISPPVIAETIVIKPTNQNNITKSNGNKNINFFLPDYIQYFLPNQSFMQGNVIMEGRGRPIPSPSAAFHSFWRKITARDGLTNSHILQETDYYNTLVSQQYTCMKTDQINNNRLMFEGLQPNNSPNNNLYWTDNAIGQWFHFANAAGSAPVLSVPLETAKANQISTTMKTDLLNNDKFIPLNVLGGCHLQLETEDYRRALEFTTGDLGVLNNSNNTSGTDGSTGSYGLCPGPIAINTDQDLTLVGAAGTSVFVANNVYEAFASGTVNPVGWILVGAVDGAGAITAAKWFCTSNAAGGVCYPNFNDAVGTNGQIDVKVGAGTVTTLAFAATGMNLGLLRVGSKDSPYYVDVAVGSPAESGITGVALSHYGL